MAGGFIDGLGIIILYDGPHKFDTAPDGNQNVVIEGLHIRNVQTTINYVKQSNGVSTTWDGFGAAIRLQTGRQVLIRGNWLENTAQGIFVNSVTPMGSLCTDLTVEGTELTNWGNSSQTSHGMYLQCIGLVAQFNYFGSNSVAPAGNALKLRSVLNFIRWNYLGQPASSARAEDWVEPQAFACYVTPLDFAYIYQGGRSTDCQPTNGGVAYDPTTAD